MKNFSFKFWVLVALSLPHFGYANKPGNKNCDSELEQLSSEAQPESARPLDKLADSLSELKLKENPFLKAGLDANAIGIIQRDIAEKVPLYNELRQLEQKQKLTDEDWKGFDRILHSAVTLSLDPGLSEIQKLALHELYTRASNLDLKRPLTEKDRQQKHISEKEEKKEDKKDKGKKEKRPPQNPWSDPEKEYVPHNKRLDSDGEDEEIELLRTTAQTIQHFYPSTHYDEFSADKVRVNPRIRERVTLSGDPKSHKKMLVSTHGKQDVVLLLPYGYQPVSCESGAKIQKDSSGNFHLLSSGSTQPIEIKLAPIESIAQAPQLHNYLVSSGLKVEEWPQEIQDFIRVTASSSASPVDKAKQVKSFIRRYYKYYSEGKESSKEELDAADRIAAQYRDKPNIIQMAHSKMLNCDGDSLTAGIWLRDYFKVPTRIVGGKTLTGIDRAEGDSWEVVTSRSVNHMWLEIWDGSKWIPFDMQPPHTPKSNGEQENKQRLANKENEDQEHSDSEDGGSESESKSEEGQEGKKDKDKDGKDSKDSHKKDGQKKGGKEKKGEEKESGGTTDLEKLQFEELKKKGNPVYALLLRAFELDLLENGLDRGHVVSSREMLEGVKEMGADNLVLSTLAKSVGETTDRILSTHTLPGSMHERFQNLKHHLSTRDFTQIFKELNQMKAELEELQKLRPLKSEEKEFLNEVNKILAELRTQAGKEGENRGILDHMLKSLPGTVSQRMLLEEIGAKDGIDSASVKNFERLWNNPNRSKYYRQLVAAGEFVEAFLNGRPEPVYRMQKTDERNPVLTQRRDVDFANRVSQIPRFIWDLKSGEHPLQPFIEGRQLTIQSRLEKPVISPRLPLVRKHTEILVDVSGSMAGKKAEAMTAMIGAFIDRCMSEKDAMGLPLNTLSITYFGQGVHSDTTINLTGDQLEQKALDQLRVFRQATIGTKDGSTSLFDAIHHSIKNLKTIYQDPTMNAKLKRKVGKGNIAVFTDGDDTGSTKGISDINALLSSLPQGMELNLKVYGLEMAGDPVGGIEVPIPKHKQRGQQKDPSASSISKEITPKDVRKITSPSVEMDDTEKSQEIVVSEGNVSKLTKDNITKLKSPNGFQTHADIFPLIQGKTAMPDNSGRSIESLDGAQREALMTLIQISRDIARAKKLPVQLRAKIAASFEANYAPLTGRRFSDLTIHEIQAIEYLKQWARGEVQ